MRAETINDIKTGTKFISCTLVNTNISTGYDTAHKMDDRDTIFDKTKETKKIDIKITAIFQFMKKVHDHTVKIPFPPLNWKKQGNICPMQQNICDKTKKLHILE